MLEVELDRTEKILSTLSQLILQNHFTVLKFF